jgi:hypothetical protein
MTFNVMLQIIITYGSISDKVIVHF